MDGEHKFLVFWVGLVIVCLTILYSLLFAALWEYRTYVGVSLLFLLSLLVAVFVRGKLNEQELRRERYKHLEEIPLDLQGEPRYWPQGAQTNPHRQCVSSRYQGQREY
jgi:hypothetical protein